jgi:hypothetical protein
MRMGAWIVDPRFLDLGTSWRWVVSFTPLPLYSRGKSLRYPLDRRRGGPQSPSGRRGERKFLILPGLERRPFGRPCRSQSLYRLPKGWTTGVRFPAGARDFVFSTESRLDLGPNQCPIKCVLGALPLHIKRPGLEADDSSPSSAEVKNSGIIIPLPHMSSWRGA